MGLVSCFLCCQSFLGAFEAHRAYRLTLTIPLQLIQIKDTKKKEPLLAWGLS